MMLKDTTNYDENYKRPFPIGKNKKVIGFVKDELVRNIMKEFCALGAKTYAYLMENGNEHKKTKGTEKCITKRKLTSEYYKDSLFNDEIILKPQQWFKSNRHKVSTEEVNKIALSSNDDKRLQTFDKVTTYPYGTNAFKVCESEFIYLLKKIFQSKK